MKMKIQKQRKYINIICEWWALHSEFVDMYIVDQFYVR